MPDLERILDRVMEPLDYIKPSVDRVVEPLATFAAGNMAFVTAATVMDMSSSWAIAGGIAVNALLAVPAYALFRNASGRIAERSYGFHIESGWSYPMSLS